MASLIPTREFPNAAECQENIVNAWEEGKRVTVLVVNASSDVAEDDNLTDNDEPLPDLADNLCSDKPLPDLADNFPTVISHFLI